MSLLDTIQAQFLEARKAKDDLAKNVLSVVLGEVQVQQGRSAQNGDVTDAQIERIIEKVVASNQETMDAMTKKLRTENALLTALLPVPCTEKDIRDVLAPVAGEIRAAKMEGMAKGIAFKAIKASGLKADSDLVTKITMEYRV